MRHPMFWGIVIGAAGYWGAQHFFGIGVSGRGKLSG